MDDLPAIGTEIETEQAFDALPFGTALRDRDGRIYTKVTTTAVAGGGQIYYAPWNWGATVFSYPADDQVRIAELEAEVETLERQNAATAEAKDRAEAAAEALADEAEYLRKAWRYALTLLDERSRDRANGYYDAQMGL